MKENIFSKLLSDYLSSYLPLQRNMSMNTVVSYTTAFRLLMTYCRDQEGLRLERIKVTDVSPELLHRFFNWLKDDRGYSNSSCNQRLAAIRAFYKYAEVETPQYMSHCQRIVQIPFLKTEKPTINYLSVEEMSAILRQPDLSTVYGRRDMCFLCLLYDTGARISEILTLKARNIYLEHPEKVILYGKGRKLREVPLLKNTVGHLSAYMKENHLDQPENLDRFLFFNHQGKPLTRAGGTYILKKYTAAAGIEKNVSPHVLRHTKAMHMLEANINLIYIKDFLGHEDISTTEVYAKASIETQRAALEKHAKVLPETAPSWANDEDLIAWLKAFEKTT